MTPGQFLTMGNGDGDEDSNHHAVDVALLFAFILLIAYVVFGSFAEHKGIKFIHETGFGIMLGILVGLAFVYADNDFYYQSMTFNPNFFMLFILPPIIFAGGYNLKKKRFFQNFQYIALFGLGGTLITFGVVAGLTIAINELKWIRRYSDLSQSVDLTLGEIMIYSATICATDSVAALAMINSDKYPKLFSVIFGEGMVNDAVSIILFQAVSTLFPFSGAQKDFEWYTVFELIGEFLLNALGAIAFGAVSGFICTLTLKWMRFLSHNPVVETCTIFFFGYISYMLAELCEWSGVIAILVSGITMSHYLIYNLSATGKVTSGVAFNFLALFAEAFLYIYLGISVWEYKARDGDASSSVAWSWTFFVLELVIVLIGRIAAVVITSGLAILIKKKGKFRLNFYELGVISYSGSIRGAIAFALIQSLPNPQKPGDKNYDQKDQLEIVKSTTLFIVIFTTIVLGSTMPLFIQWSIKKMAQSEEEETKKTLPSEEAANISKALLDKGESEKDRQYKGATQKGFKNIDEKYFKRWFIYDYENRKELIAEEKKRKRLKEENPELFIEQSMIQEEKYSRRQSEAQQNKLYDDEEEQMISRRSNDNEKQVNKKTISFETSNANVMENRSLNRDDNSRISNEQ